MILGKTDIAAALDSGAWTCHRRGERITGGALTINPNSVNVTLSDVYLEPEVWGGAIDLGEPRSAQWRKKRIDAGLWIVPGAFYLMSVCERFDCSAPLFIHGRERHFAPMIEGRSTLARCGLSIHETAGFGDYGFCGNFTLEVSARLPIVLRAGYEVAQIAFVEVSSATAYQSVYSAQFDEPKAPVIGRERF